MCLIGAECILPVSLAPAGIPLATLLAGTVTLASLTSTLWVIFLVATGLGAVIFVHELGHFAVAKMCGVKCEKFFIGFDIGGYKISRKWGETEYGIGILPLGGYVKMLGQDDNPSNIAEQVEKSQASGDPAIPTKEILGPNGEVFEVDNRSYLAKTVPQRMAIISAGVIMNVIFAFIFATIAYRMGVLYTPCLVSQTAPGAPAWRAGIRTGDEVVQVGEIRNPSFSELMGRVTLADLELGVPFKIRRAGCQSEESLTLKPQQGQGLAKVGIFGPLSLNLDKEKPVVPGTPAATPQSQTNGGQPDAGQFQGEDQVVAVGPSGDKRQPVDDYRQFMSRMVEYQDHPLDVTVRRGGRPPKEDRFGPLTGGEEITFTVLPRHQVRLGLVMEIGQISAVQQGSPAADAGIKAGDFIDQIDDRKIGGLPVGDAPIWDPVTLPEQMRRLANQNRDVQLTLRRAASAGEGRQQTDTISVALRKIDWLESSRVPSDPLAAPSLGIAYRVLSRIDAILPGSPAERAGLEQGDVITRVEFVPSEKSGSEVPPSQQESIEFDNGNQHNWPAFFYAMQWMEKGDLLKLTYRRGDQTHTTELSPVPSEDYFVAERGFRFRPVQRLRIANTFGEGMRRGRQETINSLSMVYRFLSKLGTQVPLTSLGGPVTIAKVAGYSAFEGIGKLLLFLTMLSANLAVINFLPIPLLDGGHMVFLAWEGLRGKPASEKFVVALHTIGFVFIVSLMLFVIALDLNIIPRNL